MLFWLAVGFRSMGLCRLLLLLRWLLLLLLLLLLAQKHELLLLEENLLRLETKFLFCSIGHARIHTWRVESGSNGAVAKIPSGGVQRVSLLLELEKSWVLHSSRIVRQIVGPESQRGLVMALKHGLQV